MKPKLSAKSCEILKELRSFRRLHIKQWMYSSLQTEPLNVDIFNDCQISRKQYYIRFLRMKGIQRMLQSIEDQYDR
ncbi:MAG: hypothetical protein OMM_11736 [Candidatus Magnetoglobus multicellularis str. Araruama]|uniref:Uncharacterized protein n=1 Tax=Candidatus Magnetoglobus multicellularis str. Araruama TaxID=890399 RepID=A0A1V1NXQ3_9BACT|nr:MAG: hypothetical protein OMM_11736 [Candidatus Magnetoglobus multicellularis str. Araruama]